MPEAPTPEDLDNNWIRSPTDMRMWAIEQSRGCIPVGSMLPLVVEDIMELATLLVWEIQRTPPEPIPPNIEDRDVEAPYAPEFHDPNAFRDRWKRDRGLA